MIRQQPFASPEETLAHFGIKGMKWGIRKNRTEDTVSKGDRALAKKNMKAAGHETFDRVLDKRFLGKRSIGMIPYSELDTTRRTIPAGTPLYRTTSRKDEQLRDITFVSTNELDRKRYQSVIPSLSGRGGKKSYKNHYEFTFKNTEKLMLPSEKDRVDAFNEVLTSPSIPVGRKTITGQEYLKRLGYGKHVNSVHNSKLGRKAFDDMTMKQHLNQPLSSAYFQRLRDKGFNAVHDDNDRKILSDDPVILLNPTGSLQTQSIKKLTAQDINNAQIGYRAVND